MLMNFAKRLFVAWLCVVAAIVVVGFCSCLHPANAAPAQTVATDHAQAADLVEGNHGNGHGVAKLWVCPMHPEIMLSHPGHCPVDGTKLVPYHYHAGDTLPTSGNGLNAMHAMHIGHPDVPGPAASASAQGKAKPKMWVCPMHPQIMQDHPGHCPICGMKLVPYHGAAAHSMQMPAGAMHAAQPHVPSLMPSGSGQAKTKAKMWVCPMHPQITQDHPGHCPICGMKLVPYHGAAAHSMQMPAGAMHAAQPHVPSLMPSGSGQAKTKAKMWVCPMHPQIMQDHPGHCPICGMKLVPYHGSGAQMHMPGHMAAEPEHGKAAVAPAPKKAASADHAHVPSLVAGASAQGKAKLWVCPMHPQIMQDHPGHCPICGMKLVPYHGADGAGRGVELRVSSATQQKLGVRVASAKRIDIGQPIVTYGTVQPNENIVQEITPNATGVIRKLYVTAVGDRVEVGQPLYEIYSEQLFKRQNDLIDNDDRMRQTMTSIRMTNEQNERTLRAMQQGGSILAERQKLNMRQANERNALMLETIVREDTRLRDLLNYGGITDAMIKHVLETRDAYDVFTVRATHPGYVTAISVHPGSRVKPDTVLFKTADLSRVWIDIALYPDQAPWVAYGDPVTLSLPYTNLPPMSGRISFISPLADSGTGIVHARVVLDNTDGELRPGAFVDATVRARRHRAVAIPRTALLRTGEGDMVMLALGNGHFMPARVRTGLEDGDRVEILSGLEAGAKVVVNGQFLLDAAAELSSAAQRMQATVPAGHDGD